MRRQIRTAILTLILIFSMTVSAWVPAQAAGWKQNDTGWWYQNENSRWPENEWKRIGNKWYYFNSGGYRVSGWQQVDGTILEKKVTAV